MPADSSSEIKRAGVDGAGYVRQPLVPRGDGLFAPLVATSRSKLITASVTRPTDTTTYAAGEAVTPTVAAPMTFAGVGAGLGGSGLILSAVLVDSASVAVKAIFELWLMRGVQTGGVTAAPGADADNAVFTPTDAELETIVDIIAFNTATVGDATVGVGGNAVYRVDNVNKPFECNSDVADLYGLLVVRNAYIPISAEKFTVILGVSQD